MLAVLPTTLLPTQLEAVVIADRSSPTVPLFRPR
jgi:hypothetical protein